MSESFRKLGVLFRAHRRKLAPLVLGGGVLVVGSVATPAWPHDTDIELSLGSHHREVTELRIGYVRGAEHEPLKAVTLRYPDGAPATVHHHVELPAGRYAVELELVSAQGRTDTSRRVDVPAEGVVHLHVADDLEREGT